MKRRVWFFYCLNLVPFSIVALDKCAVEKGSGICPSGNTCCLMRDGSSGCIPSDMGQHNATCCTDLETGCAVGYTCEVTADLEPFCKATREAPMSDPLVYRMPRYHLCSMDDIDLYGLDVGGGKLAYFSSIGPLENITEKIDYVAIVVHGANRNGDDYFCSMNAAAKLQNYSRHVLVVSIQFYSEVDDRDDPLYLYWKETTDGPWRYGDDSLGPIQMSSFEAFDHMIQLLSAFDIGDISIIGHSSGAQFVQRWAMLTYCWSDNMRAIIMNPSSYAYTWPLRFLNGKWQVPSECYKYNTWEWGLELKMNTNHYIHDRLSDNVENLIHRYRSKHVYYLVGGQDRCDVSTGWCHSHGLETTCMDELQGSNRFHRSANYIKSLRLQGFSSNHSHFIVDKVGHDHALMLQSDIGLQVIFGKQDLEDENTSPFYANKKVKQ
ncbi:hypothetical protein CTEN210_13991 [Chaetoceros tenuissimus]|uniref:GPI inositol-deacylase n=1 Tax=Chaetoceros tenuissimus TaxID=426638 RepID=A0AAD3HBJ0_9STRA|nr:hypothetical protein CTEN210_13991 [Chaetoceros tenuissimus]